MAAFLLFSLSGLLIAADDVAVQAKASDQLDQAFGKLELRRQTAIDGAAKLTEYSDLGLSLEPPLAPELNAPPPTMEEFTVTLKSGSRREVLDALCELDRNLAWSADGNMVNLFPRKTVGDSTYLFDRRVATLRFNRVRNAGEAVLQAVAQLPDPKEQIAFLQAGGSTAFPTPWSSTFTNITIREAFNRIARQLGPTFGWQLRGSQDFRWVTFHQRLHPRSTQAESK